MSDDADLVELAEDLRGAVSAFVRRVRALNTMPPGQAAVLGHLVRAGALSIADLARREELKHQSMTRTVSLLADQGLVTLGPAETDRRQVVVTVTGLGRQRLLDQRQVRAEFIAGAVRENLTAEERETLTRIPAILGKLTAG